MDTTTQPEKLNQAEYYQLGRIAAIVMPDLVEEIEAKYTPILKDLVHIPKICRRVINTYPNLDLHDRNVLITGIVYSLYSPATLIGCANAPGGVRKAIADVLGYSNGTNVNSWLNIASAHVKNARYVAKMNIIINHFKN